jgi:hypothetical protein
MDLTQAFRLEEYKALRAEILYQIQEIDRIKFWVAAAMAAYYSFVVAKFVVVEANNRVVLTGPIWMWAAPAVLPVLGILRLHAHVGQLGLFSTYIQKIEGSFSGVEGWEHFYTLHRDEDIVWTFDQYYFVALLVFACAVVFLRWRSVPQPPTALST